MDTHAIQILLHYQTSETPDNDDRFEIFLEEVRKLAELHRIDFDQYESFVLPSSEYKIAPCRRCAHLTIDANNVNEDIKGMVPYFWEYVRPGILSEKELRCKECENWM